MGPGWEVVIDTAEPAPAKIPWAPGIAYPLKPRSLAVLKRLGGLRGIQRENEEGI